ncbi:MAG: tripartite tricarboxylate transporter substrate binding protein [Burkholderiales bacterium]|nr:tripartite tricarboxylate transporter substrate binding protein [Burkholderiales bacterium]
MSAKQMRGLVAAATCLVFCGSVWAQGAYPTKTVTLVVPYSAGGSTDLITRLIARELTLQMGRQVVVDNRVGGSGVIGWSSVARAPADGYTLLATELSFTIAPGLLTNLPFDARKGFQQIATATSVPHVQVVTPSLPVKNVKELIALAKARPGELNFGSGGTGTNTHLGSELFKSVTGTNLTHIPYKGAGAVLTELMAGQVQVLISAAPTVLPYIASKRLRPLMVTDDKRAAVLPDVPTAVELNLPKMVMKFWVGYSAPAGTPQPVVDRLNKEIVTAVNAPEAKKRFTEMGTDAIGNSSSDATKLVSDEIDRWTAVIKAAGIKAQ